MDEIGLPPMTNDTNELEASDFAPNTSADLLKIPEEDLYLKLKVMLPLCLIISF